MMPVNHPTQTVGSDFQIDSASSFSPPQNGDLLQQRGAGQWLPGALLAQEDDGVGEREKPDQ